MIVPNIQPSRTEDLKHESQRRHEEPKLLLAIEGLVFHLTESPHEEAGPSPAKAARRELRGDLLSFHQHLENLLLHRSEAVSPHHQLIVLSGLLERSHRRTFDGLGPVDNIQFDFVVNWTLSFDPLCTGGY